MVPTTDDGETVRAFAERFVDGAFSGAAALLSEAGRTALDEGFPDEFREGATVAEALLRQHRRGIVSRYGPFEGCEVRAADDGEYSLTVEFADASETAAVEVADGAVTAFAFDEREVTVDADGVTPDGVLTLPAGDGPFPTAVLVHGAGIHNPDGPAGNAKVLRDLTHGFATEGIAPLRYQKRPVVEDIPDTEFTIDQVVVDDALTALDTVAAADEVDADGLFVVGHSQGGMCAPRIATRHGGLAGVVVGDLPLAVLEVVGVRRPVLALHLVSPAVIDIVSATVSAPMGCIVVTSSRSGQSVSIGPLSPLAISVNAP